MLVLLFVLTRSAQLRRETSKTIIDTALGSFRIIIGPSGIYISTVNRIEIRDS